MACTHPSLYVRDAHDACVVLEAVRKGVLPLWTKRLTPAERNSVRPGNIYVWEEADEKGGLERWTDGRRWTQSRMRLDFLFYEELAPLTEEDKEVKRQLRSSAEASNTAPPSRRRERMLRANGLAKQTISMLVKTGEQQTLKRWHLVAYTSLDDKRAPLPLIDHYENLRSIVVPERVFFTTRGYSWDKKPLNDRYSLNAGTPDGTMSVDSNHSQDSASRSFTKSAPSPPTAVRRPNLTYRNSDKDSARARTPSATRSLPENGFSSPSLTFSGRDKLLQITRLHPKVEEGHTPGGHSYPSQDKGYVPLSPEDRRLLNSFNLRL